MNRESLAATAQAQAPPTLKGRSKDHRSFYERQNENSLRSLEPKHFSFIELVCRLAIMAKGGWSSHAKTADARRIEGNKLPQR